MTRTDETDSMRSSDDMGSGSGPGATTTYAKVHRGAKYVSHVRKRAELSNDEDDEVDDNEMQQEESGDEKRRTPIVLAGSRKRLKGAQIPHAAEVSRLSSPQRTDEESQEPGSKKTDGEASPEDEEDELASTSSSAPSPVLAVRSSSHIHSGSVHPSHHPITASIQHAVASPHTTTYTSDTTCAGCTALQSTVESLTSSLDQLREHISGLERRLDLEMQAREEEATRNWSRVDTLCTEYDRWRKKLAGDLLSNPFASLRDPTSSSSTSS